MIIIALLFAISYAQTEQKSGVTGALPRGQQAIRLADATGAEIDAGAAVEATKNWLKEKQQQMAFLDDLQKQADSLTGLVKKISEQRPQYASSVDRKNQADSSLEEESVNYLAAELTRLKKKVDQTITERDSIVDKYVPELKAAMKKRESQITKFWEGKQVDWKKEIQDLHDQIDKLKQAQLQEINDKDKELASEREDAANKLQVANADAEKAMNKLRGEMTTQNEDNTKKVQEANVEMQQRDEKWKAQLQEAQDKNTKQFKENQAAIAEQNKKNEAGVQSLTEKYEGEIKDVEASLQKTRDGAKKKTEELTEEKQNLQKEVIQADAKQAKEIAELKKKQSDQRAAGRQQEQEKEKEMVGKLNAEKAAALKQQSEMNQRTVENVQTQADQRLANAEQTKENEKQRNKATQDRLKEQIKQEQGRTDEANKKLRSAQTQLDDLKNNMATVTAQTVAKSSSLTSPISSGTASQESEVAAFQAAPINMKIVGALVALNAVLGGFAVMHYTEGRKTTNVYQAGLLEEF